MIRPVARPLIFATGVMFLAPVALSTPTSSDASRRASSNAPTLIARYSVGVDANTDLDARPRAVEFVASQGSIVIASLQSLWIFSLASLPTPGHQQAATLRSELESFVAPGGEWVGTLARSPSGLPILQLSSTGAGSLHTTLPPRIAVHQGRAWIASECKFVLTASDLPPPAGTGKLTWSFWSRSGNLQGSFDSDETLDVFLDPEGKQAALRGPLGISLRNDRGQQVRSLSGSFGDVALARRDVVLAIEARDRTRLRVLSGTGEHALTAPGPVRKVALAPAGRLGLVALDNGRLAVLDVGSRSFVSKLCLPEPGEAFITSARIDDDGLVTAAATLKGPGEPSVSSAWIFQAEYKSQSQNGVILWHAPFPTQETSAFIPQALPAGPRRIVAWNFEKVEVLSPPHGVSEGDNGCSEP